MSLPKDVTDAVYLAITNAPVDDGAIRQAIDAIYTEVCCDLFEDTLLNPENEALSDSELKEFVDPIFSQVAEDFNEILVPYNIILGKWDCVSLAKRVDSMAKGEVQ